MCVSFLAIELSWKKNSNFKSLRSSNLFLTRSLQFRWEMAIGRISTMQISRPRSSILTRGLKLAVCLIALLLMIASCLAVSIIYNWHSNLTESNRFTVTVIVICSFSVLVNYLTILTSYITASKLISGLPQPDMDMIPVRFLILSEFISLGFFFVFIKSHILHERSKFNQQ